MIRVGALAPGFSLGTLTGTRVELAQELEHGPVALFFFKDSCGATEIAAPFVEGIWSGYREHLSAESTALRVIGISQEPAPAAAALRDRHGWSFPVALDEGLSVSRAYDLGSTPSLILLRGRERLRTDSANVADSDGFRVLDAVTGWSRTDYELLSEEISTRIGTIPVDIFQKRADLPENRPG